MIDKPQNTRPRAGRRRKSTLVGSKQSGMLRVPKFSNLRFSVVIGTKNPNSVFLKEALESCNGLFEEVIIVNDGSDRPILPAEKLEKLVSQGVKIINHKRNLGFYEARNTGIREATGDIIASLDDDDVFDPI